MSEDHAMAQARASNQWTVHGDFGLTAQHEATPGLAGLGGLEDTAYPNLLLTCINPLNGRLASDFYEAGGEAEEPLDLEISKYSGWIYEAGDRDDDLVLASHAIDSPFQVGSSFQVKFDTLSVKND